MSESKAVFSKTYEFTWSGKPYFARVHVFRNIFRGGEFCPASADVIMRGTDASGRKEVLTAADDPDGSRKRRHPGEARGCGQMRKECKRNG